MRDIRSSDIKRKYSQMRGMRIHTFEYRILENENLVQNTNIRCVIKLTQEMLDQEKIEKLSKEIIKKVKIQSLYELYSVVKIFYDEDGSEVFLCNADESETLKSLIYETDFWRLLSSVIAEIDLKTVLMVELQKNEIEGLQEELSDVTVMLSLEKRDDVIVISD